MATRKLTARGVAALATDRVQEEFWDAIVPGLAVRVGRGGSKAYIVRYRSNGMHRRLTLGRHPNLTLAGARAKARKALEAAQSGEDPAERAQERAAGDATFGALAEEVYAAKSGGWREATRSERRRILDTELLPRWKDRPAASITRRDVVQLADRLAARGSPVMANRVLATVRMLYNAGLKRGFKTIESNPAHMIEAHPESSRGRYLDRAEIKVVWDALAWEAPVVRTMFRLALLTAQRIGSCASLRWGDIDDADVWRIPAAAFKGKRPHMVPLSPEALAVLEDMRVLSGGEEYAFPGRGNGKRPHFAGQNKAMQRVRERTDIPHWTVHDLRRTFRTHATRAETPDHPKDPAGLGIAPSVADAVLGHKEASLGFDRYTAEPERYLLAEKREALRRWGAFVGAAVAAAQQ